LQALCRELEKTPRRYRVLSVGFFDTLALGLSNDSTAVFTELCRRLQEENLLPRRLLPLEFNCLRLYAEKRARYRREHAAGTRELALGDIYAEMPGLLRNHAEAARLEVQVRREASLINPSVAGLLLHAKKMGCRVGVVSDTCYSSRDLLSILDYNGFDPALIDAVVTSSETGFGKATGRPFQMLLRALALTPHEMLHLGDDPEADYGKASLMGITAFHYYKHSDRVAEVLERERLVLGEDAVERNMDSARVLAQRQCAGYEGEEGEFFRDGAFLIGPIMASFADWAVKEFKEAGIRCILTFMREGELIAEMLRRSAEAQNLGFSIQPMFASRQSTYLESVEDAPRRRAEFMAYFEPFVRGQERIGVVDLGWRGTIQHNISRILAREGRPLAISGRYLATSSLACELALEGLDIRGFLGNFEFAQNPRLLVNPMLKHPEIMEQVISANIGTTLGYRLIDENRAEPVLGEVKAAPSEQRIRNLIQEGILEFQNTWLSLRKNNPKALDRYFETLEVEVARSSAAIINRLIRFPTREEARRFGAFHHDDDFAAAVGWRRICDSDAADAFRKEGIVGKGYWPQGIVAMENPDLITNIFRTVRALSI
jgi:FMN phosphatase YigB (HAD superfamily)